MKDILNKIYEYSTPDFVDDVVEYIDNNGKKIAKEIVTDCTHLEARAFFYNVKTGDIAMANDSTQYHYIIIKDNVDDSNKKMNITYDEYDTRIEKGEDEFTYYQNHENMAPLRCGRLWDLRKSDEPSNMIVIGWWESITSNEWYKYTMSILDYYSKKNDPIDYNNTYICGIDNNCNLFIVDTTNKKTIKLSDRSKESASVVNYVRCIHLASQREKDEFFKEWKAGIAAAKERELQKLGIRDGTYAKRNNMFAKHTVFDPETKKYKVVYGAKLGDSLITKHIEDFL